MFTATSEFIAFAMKRDIAMLFQRVMKLQKENKVTQQPKDNMIINYILIFVLFFICTHLTLENIRNTGRSCECFNLKKYALGNPLRAR